MDKVQEEIIHSTEKNILVIAASGSGKTTVLIERVKWLISQGVPQDEILIITFTNLAAQEIKSKFSNRESGITISTIHGYASELLKQHGTHSVMWSSSKDPFTKLLQLGTEIAWTSKKKYVMVDEFQDLSELEYNFIMKLPCFSHFFVGDDWQSIYGFKGGCLEFLFNIMIDDSYKKYFMVNNYRTPKKILNLANKQIEKLSQKIGKKVVPQVTRKGSIEKMTFEGAIGQIKQKPEDYGKWFILVRSNKEIHYAEKLLQNFKIPYSTIKKSNYSYHELLGELKSNKVKVMTIHCSKGLENDFIIFKQFNPRTDDEEKKVKYVALTRARKRLILC